MAVIGCKPSSWGNQHLRYLTDLLFLSIHYFLLLTYFCYFLQIGDLDRCAVYVSLAPGMENPAGEEPPEEDARCTRYTSSEEDQARPIPTIEERVAGKRPMAADPSPAATLPAESSQAPKRRRLVRITDDDEEAPRA